MNIKTSHLHLDCPLTLRYTLANILFPLKITGRMNVGALWKLHLGAWFLITVDGFSFPYHRSTFMPFSS